MNAIQSALTRARANLTSVDQKTRGTISTAHTAFGGHISKGLLKRARAASDQHSTANVKHGRAAIFEKLSHLPPLTGYHITADDWRTLGEIVYSMIIWADPADRHDYHSASMGWDCYPKVEAARHFVEKYAGSRIQKALRPILYKPAP